MNPPVPKFQDHWTSSMIAYIQGLEAMGVDPQRWIVRNIEEICESWGDPYKPYSIEKILYKFDLRFHPECVEALLYFTVHHQAS